MFGNKNYRFLGWMIVFPLVVAGFSLAPKSTIWKSDEAINQVLPSDQADQSTVYLPSIERFAGYEWTQEAHDAQRTGYTPEIPKEPWTLLWTWNGPDANGGSGNHFYNAPREARTVTGGGNIYVPAGSQGIYALSLSDGHVVWNFRGASFNATPAYDASTGSVFAGGSDGKLYKINVASGSVQSYHAGNPVNRGVLLTGGYAYALTDDGHLHKVNTISLVSSWVYTSGSAASTGLAYSATRNIIIFGTADLYVHAVQNSNGTAKWHVKPSDNPAGFPNEYHRYWPVVAEQHGIVFLRMRLDHNEGLWGFPSAGNVWPTTNQAARTFLTNNDDKQNLFALSLDDGTKKFIPAVGYGGTEDLVNGTPYLDTGPVPVVKKYSNNTEVAYIFFRNGQTTNPPPSGYDGRWDSHLGEMVLDNTTVPGLVAGDLRFVNFVKPIIISDEQNPLSMAGDTIFHAHWGASESARIIDRSISRGLTFFNPITTAILPTVVRRQAFCDDKGGSTHWTSCGLTLFDDGRYWDGPGWWVYWNVMDPPTPIGVGGYSDGVRPRYTYVSAGLVIVQGNGGELFVLQHR